MRIAILSGASLSVAGATVDQSAVVAAGTFAAAFANLEPSIQGAAIGVDIAGDKSYAASASSQLRTTMFPVENDDGRRGDNPRRLRSQASAMPLTGALLRFNMGLPA